MCLFVYALYDAYTTLLTYGANIGSGFIDLDLA